MTKKSLLVLALCAFIATGAFAQIKGGFGLAYDNGPLGRVTDSNNPMSLNYAGFGIFGFADFFNYVEFSFGLSGGAGLHEIDRTNLALPDPYILTVGLLGKIPIYPNGSNSSVFPLFGAGANFILDENGTKVANYIDDDTINTVGGVLLPLSLCLGVGGDYYIGERAFLRGEVVGSYRLPLNFNFEDGGMGVTLRLAVGF